MQKLGRIITGAGVGTLVGLLIGGDIEEIFDIFGGVIIMAILAIFLGLIIIYIAKNQEKTEELKSSKKCPNCGLSLSIGCNKCPKCNTIIK